MNWWDDIFHPNCDKQANGRLHISLTKVYDGGNMLVNQFNSKEEVGFLSIILNHMTVCLT